MIYPFLFDRVLNGKQSTCRLHLFFGLVHRHHHHHLAPAPASAPAESDRSGGRRRRGARFGRFDARERSGPLRDTRGHVLGFRGLSVVVVDEDLRPAAVEGPFSGDSLFLILPMNLPLSFGQSPDGTNNIKCNFDAV